MDFIIVQRDEQYNNDKTLVEYVKDEPPMNWDNLFQENMDCIENAQGIIYSKYGKEYYPLLHNVFRIYDLCPLDTVKVVILGQDPYFSTNPVTRQPQANGIAFSTNRGCPVQPSLRNIYKELYSEYPEFQIPNHGDLTKWVQQGVLLINTCLTVKPYVAGSHGKVWIPLIWKTMERITKKNRKCIYLLWGRPAQTFEQRLPGSHILIKTTHPSPLSATRAGRDVPAFMGSSCFLKVNEELVKQGKEPVDWTLD